jgi:capsular polysaccharide biosynthesis protein
VEKAVLPQRKSSPRTFRDAALGGFIVLFIAMFFCFIKYIFDDTIKNEDDVKKYLEINTLASIPALDSNKGGQKKSRLAFSKAGGRKHGV